MIAARWPGYVGLAIGGLALAIGLVAARDDAARAARARPVELARERAAARVHVDVDDPIAPGIDLDRPSLVIDVRADGDVWVAGDRLESDELTALLVAANAADPDTQVVIRADSGVSHARVVGVMNTAKAAGLTRLALSTADAP